MERKQINTRMLHVRLSPRLRQQAEQAAVHQDRTLSDWVREQLRDATAKQAHDGNAGQDPARYSPTR